MVGKMAARKYVQWSRKTSSTSGVQSATASWQSSVSLVWNSGLCVGVEVDAESQERKGVGECARRWGRQNNLSDALVVVRGIGRGIVGSECGLVHRVELLIFANRTPIRVLDGGFNQSVAIWISILLVSISGLVS